MARTTFKPPGWVDPEDERIIDAMRRTPFFLALDQVNPKDMTAEERAQVPVKSQLEYGRLSPYGMAGDDLLGYWRDRDGNWWRDPYGPFGML